MIEVALYAHNPLLGEPSRTTNTTIEVDTSSPLVSLLIQPAWTLQNWNQDSALSPTPFTSHPTLYTRHPATYAYTLQPTPFTLYTSPITLNPEPKPLDQPTALS